LHTELVALILYRRHTKACPIHKSGLKARAKRLFMDCECPFRMYGRTDTSFVPRQSTGFTGLAEAEALRSSLIAQSKDETVHGPRIATASKNISPRVGTNWARKPPVIIGYCFPACNGIANR
jgi:hypothetical protein